MSESLNNIGGFSFDEWAQLFRDNPEEFERCRTQALEALIQKANPISQNRLRELVETFNIVADGRNPEERLQIAVVMLDKQVVELASATMLFSKIVVDVLKKKI